MRRRTVWVVVLLVASTSAWATPLADSEVDFSLVQGMANWRYGYLRGDGGSPPTPSTPFIEFGTTSGGTQWKATTAQVGSVNTMFLNLNESGGHPCGIGPGSQNSIIWPTRRYTMPSGPLSFVYEFSNLDQQPYENMASGTSAHVLVDGVEVAFHASRNADNVPRAKPVIVLDAGSIIDFAADPHGVAPFPENEYSARTDGFRWHVRGYVYPCGSDLDCGDIRCIQSVCCDPSMHACGDAGIAFDAGFDAGRPVVDAGLTDGGLVDGGVVSDAGVTLDAGPKSDAGTMGTADSGVVKADAGTSVSDAGVKSPSDAGRKDGGTGDAGQDDEPHTSAKAGCGCQSTSELSVMGMALVWALRRLSRLTRSPIRSISAAS